MVFLKRWWRAASVAWRVLRYPKYSGWDRDDAEVLAKFLNSPTGVRLKAQLVAFILDSGQRFLADGGRPFDAGTAHGMRTLWVYIETLKSAGVAPQDDEIADETY